jgi:hypothetical protein
MLARLTAELKQLQIEEARQVVYTPGFVADAVATSQEAE